MPAPIAQRHKQRDDRAKKGRKRILHDGDIRKLVIALVSIFALLNRCLGTLGS